MVSLTLWCTLKCEYLQEFGGKNFKCWWNDTQLHIKPGGRTYSEKVCCSQRQFLGLILYIFLRKVSTETGVRGRIASFWGWRPAFKSGFWVWIRTFATCSNLIFELWRGPPSGDCSLPCRSRWQSPAGPPPPGSGWMSCQPGRCAPGPPLAASLSPGTSSPALLHK